jgi:hypothetical protein
MFNLFKSKDETNHFSRNATAIDLTNIQITWKNLCDKNNKIFPKKVSAEFNKRIKLSKSGKGKAKLNFSKCSLKDDQINFLFHSLSVKPVISKLNLNNNKMTNKSAKVLLNLLKGQEKITKFDYKIRSEANFLGDIDLENNNELDPNLITELLKITTILKHSNASANIKKIFLSIGAPDNINVDIFDSVWDEIIGDYDIDNNIDIIKTKLYRENKYIYPTYEEMHDSLIQQLIHQNHLPQLPQWLLIYILIFLS